MGLLRARGGAAGTSEGGIVVAMPVNMIPNELTHGQNGTRITEPPPLAPVDTVRDELVPISLDDQLRAFEASLITWALTTCRGNKSKAARLLQVKRSTLGDRIRRCGVDDTTGTGRVEERR